MSVVTPSELASWMKVPTPSSEMQLVIDAVEEYLLDTYDLPAVWTERIKTAVKMQAARIIRRQGTPEGIAQFGDVGVLRVSGCDADVEALLRRYMPWGFA